MSTKKILLIIGGVVAVLGLVGALFVGGIVWFGFSAIGKSEAAETARTFLRQNEKLKNDIGEVKDFGFFVTGNVNTHNSSGVATLNLKVIGARKTVQSSVDLSYRSGGDWRVVEASYRNDAGQTVNLLDAYDTEAEVESEPVTAESDETGAPVEGFDEESFAANVLEAEGPALVVFLSKYSLDSQKLVTTLAELVPDYAERVALVRYSVDEQPVVLKRFNVEKMPTLILYKDGAEQERLTGAVTKQNLARLLDKYLESE
jgi:thioredoxin 1